MNEMRRTNVGSILAGGHRVGRDSVRRHAQRSMISSSASSGGEADLRSLAVAWRDHREEEAARALIAALYPQVIRIVRNHLPRGTDPAELAQQVFVLFFRTLERYDPAQPLENWVSRLTLNVCLNALRAARRRPEVRWSDLTEDERRAAEALLQPANPEPAVAPVNETRHLLDSLLDTLAPEDRMVITLLHLEERSVAEIAGLTGWSRVVVRMRAYRARRRLRSLVAQLGAERP